MGWRILPNGRHERGRDLLGRGTSSEAFFEEELQGLLGRDLLVDDDRPHPRRPQSHAGGCADTPGDQRIAVGQGTDQPATATAGFTALVRLVVGSWGDIAAMGRPGTEVRILLLTTTPVVRALVARIVGAVVVSMLPRAVTPVAATDVVALVARTVAAVVPVAGVAAFFGGDLLAIDPVVDEEVLAVAEVTRESPTVVECQGDLHFSSPGRGGAQQNWAVLDANDSALDPSAGGNGAARGVSGDSFQP